MNPWIWATAAAVAAILEIHAPGYYLIWVSLGAALTALLTWLLGFPLPAQLMVFAIMSSIACVFGYFVYRRLQMPDAVLSAMNQRGRSMIGARGVVCVALAHGQGKVRLGDSVWLAEGPDMEVGTSVEVSKVRNTVVIVKSVASPG
jgi:membrane protein implicated in regulation of membrane protease activity